MWAFFLDGCLCLRAEVGSVLADHLLIQPRQPGQQFTCSWYTGALPLPILLHFAAKSIALDTWETMAPTQFEFC